MSFHSLLLFLSFSLPAVVQHGPRAFQRVRKPTESFSLLHPRSLLEATLPQLGALQELRVLSAGPVDASVLALLPRLLAAAPGGPDSCGGGAALRELSLSFAPAPGFTAADLSPLGQCASVPNQDAYTVLHSACQQPADAVQAVQQVRRFHSHRSGVCMGPVHAGRLDACRENRR